MAAGALQIQGASSGRLGGPRSRSGAEPRLLRAPGVRPGRAATTLGGRGRLGVGIGRGRCSSSPFRRPSSRLPRPLFLGWPSRLPAGPFTFKESYEVAVAEAPGAQRGPVRRTLPPAEPSLPGPGAEHAPGARPAGHTPARPPAWIQGESGPGLCSGPGPGEWGRASPLRGMEGMEAEAKPARPSQ